MPEFTDMWSQLLQHPPDSETITDSNAGYTFDTTLNPMIGQKYERMRYDRIVHRLLPSAPSQPSITSIFRETPAAVVDDASWTAASIQIIGNSPITETRDGGARSCIPSADATEPAAESNPYDSPPAKGAQGMSRPVMIVPPGAMVPVPLFPSDHFGLYSEFVLRTAEETAEVAQEGEK